MEKFIYNIYCIRSHFEFAIPVWNPYLIKDKNTLEKVQERATKVSQEIRKLSYEMSRTLGLYAQKERRSHSKI